MSKKYNIFEEEILQNLRKAEPERFKTGMVGGGEYFNLQGLDLEPPVGVDIKKMEQLAKIMRALIFIAVEAGQSGHPGGSSSKVEQFLAMTLGGVMAFDPICPKHPGRDRVVWSAGHCTPALYGGLALFYESLRRTGRQFAPAVVKPVMPEDLIRFRHIDGPQGHIESYYPLADTCTGPSGHGLSAALGMALSHKSSGLNTKVWVLMGDAETEEGMSYEARNIAAATGQNNLIVSLDYNHFGIDGPIEEAVASPYLNHWLGMGWNVIEVDGHNFSELISAYRLASRGIGRNNLPTVILAHTIKGKCYGVKENSAGSHGSPAKHEDYVELMNKMGFDIEGKAGNVALDIEKVLEDLSDDSAKYVVEQLEEDAKRIVPEGQAMEEIKKALKGRPIVDPMSIKRPENLPAELIFEEGSSVSTRKATEAWFKWMMQQTTFFYVGTGDLSKSILTAEAENVYGLISRQNPFGRGIRFGIAEQNMAMMSAALTQDILPGGYHPISAFGSYAVFTSMMSNCVRLALISNHLNPDHRGFFIMIAAHDGPETGEDGPTHQGLYWMSMFNAYPGIKVYKPFDANEAIEMMFYALEKGEPIALSLVRSNTPVLKREEDVPLANEAVNGAYVYKKFKNNGKQKIVLAISGIQVLMNVLETMPELEAKNMDVKIINVTSPELFEDLCRRDPKKALEILPDEERALVVALHNGWQGFLYPFLLPPDYAGKNISINQFLRSGSIKEVYEYAQMTPQDLLRKISRAINH
ncbi:MAG: hypothetical protein COU29_03845 [Candidatus Magasanikbacteria bacterium CG10_big_fil_rev_8_21_14_0_10_36_32]|uniref:Transketolase-like pyrimidine-binding domain-containing protein n=1 Tax=Candidatus Magasanikbacteria bacterium CG10_big_fil_rev_8_21_14_0_10_36_32 TaxID=1974646 RepID=A0A2M6W5N1_9BACT|nr:MAG: hypothetical protein COU29_03845 [Candidatus Magasanikbacteria bacterium CG10_big_fil_rev_8_21_14_0_10_36_32]